MEKIILINREVWETRVAVLEKGILQDLYFDKKDHPSLEKGFIKGEIINVLPGIQTVFVNIGQEKAGFLHISEVDKNLVVEKVTKKNDLSDESTPKKKICKNLVDISKIFKNKEFVLVQVKKEAISTKGAKLTTSFTLPGKYLVLMPNSRNIGISSKIESREERIRLKELLDKLLPEEMGVVVRTDAENKSEEDLTRDLQFLITTWKNITQRYKTAQTGEFLHTDLPLAVRTIREHTSDEEVTVFCNDPRDQDEIEKFVKKFMPNNQVKLLLNNSENLFKKFDIDRQINALLHKKVNLASGGNIIIENTEAMAVIDVNTSKFVGKSSQEETTLRTNLEAAKEVVRQLRLRNIGGIIIIDFIDMHKNTNKNALMACLSEELKTRDKLKSVPLKLSELGLIQMTRKRSGKSLAQQLMDDCTECHGSGLKKTNSTVCSEVLHDLKDRLAALRGQKIELHISEEMFTYISSVEYRSILGLEKNFNVKILLVKNKKLTRSDLSIVVLQ